jgi:hypothetical protein
MADQQNTSTKLSTFSEEFDSGLEGRLNRGFDRWVESCRQRDDEKAAADRRLDQIEVNDERWHSEAQSRSA